MERDHQAPDVIDLGSVSQDTRGDDGKYWEGFAAMPGAGLSEE